MQLTKQQVNDAWKKDKKKDRIQLEVMIAITVAIFLFSLCCKYNAYAYEDKFKSLITVFKDLMAIDFSQGHLAGVARLEITCLALISGAGLSIAGAIFQTIYKNPLASPNMLGATAGVKLGNILMVTLYSDQAMSLIILRHQYCYGLTAICVVLILILGRLAGDKSGNVSVMEMVMAGSVVSQGLNVLAMYYMYRLEDEDLALYQRISMGNVLQLDNLSLFLFFSVMIISLLPIILLRYRFNMVAIDASEAKSLGINPMPIRVIGQVCAVLMVTAAMIQCGDTGMISMVIPYLVRGVFGANTKKVIVFSGLIGGCLMMICWLLSSFIAIDGEPLPIAFIVSILVTPIFLVIMVKQRRVFD